MKSSIRLLLIPAVCLGLLLTAAPAQAAKQDPRITKALLSVTDLSPSYGKPAKVWANDLGKGVLPTACFLPAAGSQKVDGKPDEATFFKEIDYTAAGTTWQDTVYMYPSIKKSKASYDQMLAGAKARCNSEYSMDVSDDSSVAIPATQNNETEVLDPVIGMPRFAVYQSTTLENQEQATNGYSNQWVYTVLLRDGSVIHQVTVISTGPLQAVQLKDARSAIAKTATRFSSLP